MDTGDPPPAPLDALRAVQAGLAPLLTRAKDPPSTLDTALAGLYGWLGRLVELGGAPPDSTSELPILLREKHLSFMVPSGAERGEGPEGKKAVAVFEAVRGLLEWLLERVLPGEGAQGKGKYDEGEKDEGAWGPLLTAVLLGVERHLGDNDFDSDGRSKKEVMDYRTLFANRLFAPLVHVVFPVPVDLPAASGQGIDDSRANVVPSEAKYAALAVLAQAMSKHKENKRALRELLPADHLGSILHGGSDAHLSQLALEIAYRIAPPAPKRKSQALAVPTPAPASQERTSFINTLFTRQRFGNDAVKWRELFDSLEIEEWEEQTRGLLEKLAQMHIKRSQPFRVLSLDYDGHALLDRPTESQEPSSNARVVPPKPTVEQIASHFYEPATVWLCRHIVAVSLREPDEMLEARKAERAALELPSQTVPLEEGEDVEHEKERAVLQLSGVEKVHVEDLGQSLGLFRVTILIASTSPLTIGSRAHPARPTHVGRALKPASDSQHKAGLKRMHKLVMVLGAKGDLGVLKKALDERSSIYPKLGDELHRFPLRAVADLRPAATAMQKAVTFAPAPPATGPSSLTHRRTEVAVQRAQRKSSEAGPVVAQPVRPQLSQVAEEAEDDARESSQEASLRRREKVAALAKLDGRASTSGSGSAGASAAASSPAKTRSRESEHDDDPFAGHEFGGGFEEDVEMGGEGEEEAEEVLPPPSKVGAPAPSPKPVPGHAATAKPVQRTSSDVTDPATHSSPDLEVHPAPKKVVVKPAAAAPTKAKRRSPRVSEREGSPPLAPTLVVKPKAKSKPKTKEKPTVIIQVDDSHAAKRAPASKKKKVVAVAHDKINVEKENDEPASVASIGRGRPRRAAASKADAMLKGTKRGRSEEDDDEADAAEEFEEEVESSKTRASAGRGKKVVKPAATAPAKRRKTSPSASVEPEPDTDYDDDAPPHATLDPTRRSDSPAKRYGRERKPVTATGGMRKAAPRAKAGKAAKSPAKTRKGKAREEKEALEGSEQEERSTRARAPGKRVVKRVLDTTRESSLSEAHSSSPPPPAKKQDKRVSDEIPPPRDLSSGELKRAKELERVNKPRSSEGACKEKPVRSFSQLVRSPPDEEMAAKEPLAAVEENAVVEVDQDEFSVYYHDDLAHVPAIDAAVPGPSDAREIAIAKDQQPRLGSLSPFLDPAKDETFVDRAVAGMAPPPVMGKPVSKAKAASEPAAPILPAAAQPAPAEPLHRVKAHAQAHQPMQVDSPAAGPRGADDSGVHFVPPLEASDEDAAGGEKVVKERVQAVALANAIQAWTQPAPAQTVPAQFGMGVPHAHAHAHSTPPATHNSIFRTVVPSVAGPSGARAARPPQLAATGGPGRAHANKAVQVGASLGAPPPWTQRAAQEEEQDEEQNEIVQVSRPPPAMLKPAGVPPRTNGGRLEPLARTEKDKGKGRALSPRSARRAAHPSTSTPRYAHVARPSTSPPQHHEQQHQQYEQELPQLDGPDGAREDEELFRCVEGFGRALVEKQRERRAARDALHAQGVTRVSEIVGRYLAAVHDETAELADRVASRVHALQAPPHTEAQTALTQVWGACDRVWQNAQRALDELKG